MIAAISINMTQLELIGAGEAATILGLSRPGLTHRVRSGKLRPAGLIGKRGTMVFDRAEIERIAAEGREQ